MTWSCDIEGYAVFDISVVQELSAHESKTSLRVNTYKACIAEVLLNVMSSLTVVVNCTDWQATDGRPGLDLESLLWQ